MKAVLSFLLLLGTAAHAQVPGAISVSAARTVTLAPETATFRVSVTAGAAVSFQTVLETLKDTGFTARELVSIASAGDYYQGPGVVVPARLTYQFEVPVPYSKMSDTVQKLDAARKTFVAADGSLSYSASVSAGEGAIERARQQMTPELVAEARRKAEFLAGAAGLKLGAIQSLGDAATGGAIYAVVSAYPIGATLRVTFSVGVTFAAQPQ